MHEVNHEYSQKRQNGDIKRVEEPKGHKVGAAQAVSCFGLNIGKLELTGAFSLEKLVNYCL